MAEKLPNGLIKYGDLTMTQHEYELQTVIAERLKHESFWAQFVGEVDFREGRDHLEVNVLKYNELTPSDVKAVEEGITPAPSALHMYRKMAGVNDYLRWIPYTDKTKKYAYDDLISHAKDVIGDEMLQIREIILANKFIETKAVLSAQGDETTWDTLTRARIRLEKNKVKKIDGYYYAIVTSEYAALITKENKDYFEVAEKNKIQKEGYIGTLNGFRIFSCTDAVLYDSSNKSICLFFGALSNGLPVKAVKCGEGNVQAFDNGLGSLPDKDHPEYGDPGRQRGSVAVKLMGFGAILGDDNAVLKYVDDVAYVAKDEVSEENQTDYKANSKEASPITYTITGGNSISGTGSITLAVKDNANRTVTGWTLASSDTAYATVSGMKVTGVKAGNVTITLTKGDIVLEHKVTITA